MAWQRAPSTVQSLLQSRWPGTGVGGLWLVHLSGTMTSCDRRGGEWRCSSPVAAYKFVTHISLSYFLVDYSRCCTAVEPYKHAISDNYPATTMATPLLNRKGTAPSRQVASSNSRMCLRRNIAAQATKPALSPWPVAIAAVAVILGPASLRSDAAPGSQNIGSNAGKSIFGGGTMALSEPPAS